MLARILQQSTISTLQVYKRTKYNLCYLCLDPTLSRKGLCSTCFTDLPRITSACPRCSEPNRFGHICGRCITHPPAFARVIAPFQYVSPLNALILRLKQGRNGARPALVAELADQLTDFDFDFIVPLPYHWRRLVARGYHPTAHITHLLSQHLSIPAYSCLKRKKMGSSQQGLSREQRGQNVRNAFQHITAKPVNNKNLLLVDDVMTTGATANEASRTLIKAGAKSVSIACLARTPTQTG